MRNWYGLSCYTYNLHVYKLEIFETKTFCELGRLIHHTPFSFIWYIQYTIYYTYIEHFFDTFEETNIVIVCLMVKVVLSEMFNLAEIKFLPELGHNNILISLSFLPKRTKINLQWRSGKCVYMALWNYVPFDHIWRKKQQF